MHALEPHRATAIVLGGIAVLHAVLDLPTGRAQPGSAPAPVAQALPAAGSSARKTLEWCLQNVTMVHDVYWASACTLEAQAQQARRSAEAPDDSTDCTLPERRAAALNAARAQAEQQCLEDARH